MFEKFELGYYRAYAEPQVFDFVSPREGKLGLNVIVGQNNSGKSTALSVLKELFEQSPDFIHDSMSRVDDHPPVVNLRTCFENDPENDPEEVLCKKITEGFYAKLIKGLNQAESDNRRTKLRQSVRFLPSRRAWTDRFNRNSRPNKTQLEDQLFGLQRNQEAQLGQILSNIIRDNDKPKFDAILKRVMPDVVDWGVNRFLDQDYIEYKSPAGKIHALSLLGEGLSSVFRMTYTLFSSKPGDVVILDEPELSLHPDAQKSLYALLSELSENRQIIIATHSPYMVNWEDLGRGARLFRVGLDGAGTARVHSLTEAAIQDVMPVVEGDIRNRKLFDILAKEVFFRSSVVFCEGQEDVHYIENYLEKEDRKSLPLFGYGSGGDSLIKKWLVLASDLGIRAAGLYDANVAEEAKRVEAQFGNDDGIRIWQLPADDIRDKDQNGTVQLGIFNTRGEINVAYRADFEAMLQEIEEWLAV